MENPEFTDKNTAEAKEAQKNYIETYLNDLEKAVYGTDHKNEAGKHYTDYMDTQSIIDYYLIQEFSENGDAYISGSTYLYKKRKGLLYWGPLWDFDFVAWAAYQTNYDETEEFNFTYRAPWISELLQDDTFKAELIRRWEKLGGILKSSVADGGILDQYEEQMKMTQLTNYQVQSSYLLDKVDYWGEGEFENLDENGDPYDLTYDNEIKRLKKWILKRASFFDENIGEISTALPKVVFMVDGEFYGEASVRNDYGYLDESTIPADPKKEGYLFMGWYRLNDEGEEIALDTEEPQILVDEETGAVTPYTYFAKWREGSIEELFEGIKFTNDTFYVPHMVYSEDDEDGYYISRQLVILPDDLPETDSYISWSVDNTEVAEISEDGWLSIKDFGDVEVTAECFGKKAVCTVHIVPYADVEEAEDFEIESRMSVQKGTYGQLKTNFLPSDRIEPVYYLRFHFLALDTEILTVDNYGFLYAKNVGTTEVMAFNEVTDTMHICKVTVTDGGTEPSPAPVVKKTFTAGGAKYQITGKKTVAYIAHQKKAAKRITVPKTVTYKKVKYQVTEVGTKAFSAHKKLAKVTLGENVKKIGKEAFSGCKKLKRITIKTKKLKSVGKNVLKGVPKKCKLTYPKGKRKKYKKLFRR